MFDTRLSRTEANSLAGNVTKNKEKISSNIKADYNSNYVGVVVDTNDPLRLGRVRVRIPAIMGTQPNQSNYLSDSEIPWAYPGNSSGSSNDSGSFIVPAKGTTVYTIFEGGSFTKPIYMGNVSTVKGKTNKIYNDNKNIYGGEDIEITDNDRIKDLSDNSAQSVVYKSLKGTTIIMDDKDGYENIKIIDATGQVFEMGNASGSALKRRGKKESPSKTSSPYISLRTNSGTEISLTGEEIEIINEEGLDIIVGEEDITIETEMSSIIMSDDSIDITNNETTTISITEDNIDMTLKDSNILMTEDSLDITTKGNSITMTEDNTTLSTKNATVTMGENTLSMSNGKCSVNLNGNDCNISGTSLKFNGRNVKTE